MYMKEQVEGSADRGVALYFYGGLLCRGQRNVVKVEEKLVVQNAKIAKSIAKNKFLLERL